MSRLRRIEQSHRYFFITTNLENGVEALEPNARTMILNVLGTIRSRHDFLLLAYVVMPDHLHLMICPRKAALSTILRDFKTIAVAELNKARRSHGPVWQSRFFDFICRRVRDHWSKIDYIHQNPVAAGLAESAERWRWSSAYQAGETCRTGVLCPDRIEMPLGADTLLWPSGRR